MMIYVSCRVSYAHVRHTCVRIRARVTDLRARGTSGAIESPVSASQKAPLGGGGGRRVEDASKKIDKCGSINNAYVAGAIFIIAIRTVPHGQHSCHFVEKRICGAERSPPFCLIESLPGSLSLAPSLFGCFGSSLYLCLLLLPPHRREPERALVASFFPAHVHTCMSAARESGGRFCGQTDLARKNGPYLLKTYSRPRARAPAISGWNGCITHRCAFVCVSSLVGAAC